MLKYKNSQVGKDEFLRAFLGKLGIALSLNPRSSTFKSFQGANCTVLRMLYLKHPALRISNR